MDWSESLTRARHIWLALGEDSIRRPLARPPLVAPTLSNTGAKVATACSGRETISTSSPTVRKRYHDVHSVCSEHVNHVHVVTVNTIHFVTNNSNWTCVEKCDAQSVEDILMLVFFSFLSFYRGCFSLSQRLPLLLPTQEGPEESDGGHTS